MALGDALIGEMARLAQVGISAAQLNQAYADLERANRIGHQWQAEAQKNEREANHWRMMYSKLRHVDEARAGVVEALEKEVQDLKNRNGLAREMCEAADQYRGVTENLIPHLVHFLKQSNARCLAVENLCDAMRQELAKRSINGIPEVLSEEYVGELVTRSRDKFLRTGRYTMDAESDALLMKLGVRKFE